MKNRSLLVLFLLLGFLLIFVSGERIQAGETKELEKTAYTYRVVAIGQNGAQAEGRFMLSLSGNYLSPSDSGFKDIYGSSAFYPEIKAAVKVIKDIYVWGSYGFFSKNGETPVLKIAAESTQNYLSFGVGHLFRLSEKLDLDIVLGAAHISYKEEAMGMEISGSRLGLCVKGGVIFHLTKNFFTTAHIGYLAASDTVNDVKIKLGGMTAGIGVGITL